MSVTVIAISSNSGLPIFCRRKGNLENIQFSTIASLHSINTFIKCYDLSLLKTNIDNGVIAWKECCKSITLIGIATGGLEIDLNNLLTYVYHLMIFCYGKHNLEQLKNVDNLKRDIGQFYPQLDHLLDCLNPKVVSSHFPIILEHINSMLCPRAQQLQQALDTYASNVGGRWACLCIHGLLVTASSDFIELSAIEAKLIVMLAYPQDGAPLRETLVYLPHMSPNVAFRVIICKLLADVYILVVCGADPPLSEMDDIVLKCWGNLAHVIKEAKLVYPRNMPSSIQFEPCVLAVLLVNIEKRRYVFSRHLNSATQKCKSISGEHIVDVLRTFYVTSAKDLITQPTGETDEESDELAVNMCETYWCSEHHSCHAQRAGALLCCVLYAPNIPVHTIRMITAQILQSITKHRDICWC